MRDAGKGKFPSGAWPHSLCRQGLSLVFTKIRLPRDTLLGPDLRCHPFKALNTQEKRGISPP